MTAIGKIFVFIVLFLSLVQGAFAVLLYTARTHWSAQYVELDKKYQVARANADQYAAEAKKAETDADARIAQMKLAMKKLQDDSDLQTAQIRKLEANEQARARDNLRANETITAAQAEVQRRQADVDHLRKTLTTQMDLNKTLVDQKIALQQEKISAEIQMNAYREQNKQLVVKLEDMARDNARSRVPALAAGGTMSRTSKNPPQDSIEGLIRQSDPSGLVRITIGSDAGLVKGHTLEVFRLSNVPDQSKYLGTIRIINVNATEAVGEPMGRMAAPVQVGDRVASRILGS